MSDTALAKNLTAEAAAPVVLKEREIKALPTDELLSLYKRTGIQEYKWPLVLRYEGLIKSIALQICGVYSGFAQVDDIVNEGIITLMNSVDKFDPEKGTKFETYVSKRIRGMIIDLARQQDWLPRSVRKRAREIDQAVSNLSNRLNRFPTDREIAEYMPHVHPSVEGIFKPRDRVLTVINLPKYLTGLDVEQQPKDLFIVTNFNKMYIAFRVHSVVGICRISWRDIQKPDNAISGGADGVATGIAQCGDDLVTILDFEKIVAEIAPETSIQISEIDQLGPRKRSSQPVYIAEDSLLLSQMIKDSLGKAGYTNLHMGMTRLSEATYALTVRTFKAGGVSMMM